MSVSEQLPTQHVITHPACHCTVSVSVYSQRVIALLSCPPMSVLSCSLSHAYSLSILDSVHVSCTQCMCLLHSVYVPLALSVCVLDSLCTHSNCCSHLASRQPSYDDLPSSPESGSSPAPTKSEAPHLHPPSESAANQSAMSSATERQRAHRKTVNLLSKKKSTV